MSGSLAEALVRLGSVGLACAEREDAAKSVLERVGPWALPHFRRVYAGQLAQLAPDEAQDLLAQAVEETVVAAIRGGFRSGSERGAHAWCKCVMNNYILGQLRRMRRSSSRPPAGVGGDPGGMLEPVQRTEPKHCAPALARLVNLLRQEIRRSSPRRYVSSVVTSLELYVEGRTGVSAKRQSAEIRLDREAGGGARAVRR